jgi:hypothetical protein
MSDLLLDRAGRRRSPATLPGFHARHAPGNKGLRYPADPPKIEEIIAVMRTAGDWTPQRVHGTGSTPEAPWDHRSLDCMQGLSFRLASPAFHL